MVNNLKNTVISSICGRFTKISYVLGYRGCFKNTARPHSNFNTIRNKTKGFFKII